ncbi:6-bladed beta-propeller [Brachyspira hyodysenteriae]|uniref:NHL repeat containing protein n=2 Tax=Brachyspira hyodysenteriae TaxID=159 RepID=A0A3B6VAI6_BRAHW|nr:6-bladed beta-propeller [Brachyspira hyodysenteriae]ACN83157.1 NHL repeat containing protein [Brachyspira hyodysenteriae WA1]ANN64728.1 6-bladed beta-propeller [Brachyspira hyodysenteriae ATCC 27164]AUJ48900.1 NHL repeat containing protein [Brachyspira hyodysenteriae]KLI13675.1 NHL repeat containing protein [Brachyspira hyodysenteriae]KLI14839.1 NHL repeat containing protein [Brachyspira hyodysenteriae]
MRIKLLAVIVLFLMTISLSYTFDKTPYYVNTETYDSYRELLRGVHYYNQERYDASIASFRNSLNTNPTDKFIRYWYSKSLYKAGYMSLAINEWLNITRMGYEDPIILSKINKYDSANVNEERENILSNFIYLKAFSTNLNFRKNINQPIQIKVMSDGSLYVLDYSDSSLKKFDINGNLIGKISHGKRLEKQQTSWWRNLLQFAAKVYPYEKLENPRGFDIDANGYIYIANTKKDKILKYDANHNYITNIGVSGVSNGQLLGPSSVAVDREGNLYVSDTGNNRIVIFDIEGNFLYSFGKLGENNGEFFSPAGIAVDDKYIYVADMGNKRIQQFDLSGNYIQSIKHNLFNEPRGLSFAKDGNLYIADGSKVFYYNIAESDFTIFNNSERYTVTPTSIAEGPDGNIYLTDFMSGRIDVYTRKEEYYANLDVFVDREYLNRFPVVVASVTVRDRAMNPVVGLTPENFFVTENAGVAHKVGFYDAPELHEYRFVYLIEDSLAAKPYESRIKEEISNFTMSLTNNDEVLVIHYNDQVYKSDNYDARNLRILENANAFHFTGGISALDDAYYEAIRLSGNSFKKTAIIHFSVTSPDDRVFDMMNFNDVASFAKNNAVSLNQVYIGTNKSNYFLDLMTENTYGYIIDADYSINYTAELNRMKNINFGRYFIYYNSFRNLAQSGQFRALNVKVQYRDMYGEEEVGYVVP